MSSISGCGGCTCSKPRLNSKGLDATCRETLGAPVLANNLNLALHCVLLTAACDRHGGGGGGGCRGGGGVSKAFS